MIYIFVGCMVCYFIGYHFAIWRKRSNEKEIKRQARYIYVKMNSYSNPSKMNDVDKEWILLKIEEGIKEYLK